MRLNQTNIIGRLGADSRLQNIGEHAVLNFDVAVSAYKKDGRPTWFRCSLWGERARKLEQYLVKGQAVFVSGEVSCKEYIRKQDGLMSASLEIRVAELQLLGGRTEER